MRRSLTLSAVVLLLLAGLLAVAIRSSLASAAGQDKPAPPPVVVPPAAVEAASPIVFSYQGQLNNAAGNPITNSGLPMTFRLYTTLTGGTTCWTESQNVNVQNGQFNVLLGQSTAIESSCLSGTNYLELVVNSEVMSPRELLTSVPYSAQANTLPAAAQIGPGPNIGGHFTAGPPGNEFLFDTRSSQNGDMLNITSRDPGGPWKYQGLYLLDSNGYVGINNMSPIEALDVNGNAKVRGDLTVQDSLGAGGNVCNGNGTCLLDTDIQIGHQYALHVQAQEDRLHLLPFANDLFDQVCIGCGVTGRGLIVRGGLEVQGGCTQVGNREDGTFVDDADCEPGSITSGAYVEANLMTPDERAAETVDRFERGDLLCWSANDQQLDKCATANDPLVMGVADANGKPIVLGAEQIKVIGPVQAGDYLVASDTPGYAQASDDPSFGIVIGQALEEFDGESGLILAMIRKM